MAETLYGYHSVREGLRGRRQPIELYVAEELRQTRREELLDLAQARRIPVRNRTRHDLDLLAGNTHHQGAVLKVEPFPYIDFENLIDLWRTSEFPAMFLLIDGVTDPHNLGAILRNAYAAGCHGVVIPKDRNCRITSTVDRASAGAVEHLAISQVTNLARAIMELKSNDIWVYGLATGESSQNLYKTELTGHLALIIGNEGTGLRRRTRSLCDFLLSIPMVGGLDSLNAASASAVALFEAVRQRSSG